MSRFSVPTDAMGVATARHLVLYHKESKARTRLPFRFARMAKRRLVFLRGDNALSTAELDGSNAADVFSESGAYAFAHGFVLRTDGAYAMYDRPRSGALDLHRKAGFECVVVDMSDGSTQTIASIGDLRRVEAWFPPVSTGAR